jgi:hypothetical protein
MRCSTDSRFLCRWCSVRPTAKRPLDRAVHRRLFKPGAATALSDWEAAYAEVERIDPEKIGRYPSVKEAASDEHRRPNGCNSASVE